MKLQDQARSISQKLSTFARKEKTTFQNVSTEFLIERLLARITSDKKLYDSLVFKGGYVGLRIYNSPRYTIDLDALLIKSDVPTTLKRIRTVAAIDLNDAVWFHFESEMVLKTQGEYGGIRLQFRTGIGEVLKDLRRAQIIHLDLGIGDPVTPGPVLSEVEEMLGKNKINWKVYPLETMIAEKIHALVERGSDNSRSKDVFDLFHFLPEADHDRLSLALKECFEFRKTNLPQDLGGFMKSIDTGILKMGWTTATAGIPNAPLFEDCFGKVIEFFILSRK